VDEPLIQLTQADLVPTPGGEISLRGVSWSVRRGDWWVLAGPPNCGKSSLLMAMGVMHPLAGGELRLFGQSISPTMGDELASLRRGIGLLFEGGGHLFEHATVLENVSLPVRYHHNLDIEEAEERVRPFLEACGLGTVSGQVTRHLNRAQRRRVTLARALVLQPEVLLIDNPVAGLDPGQVRWWRGFLSQLNAGHPAMENRAVTLVLATDDLRPWLPLAQQFAVVRERTLTAVGDRIQLKTQYGDLLAQLLDDEPR
jgi:ABC-type transporter Mla maintaining outer membrane lipid asymmetry ATPase subunit MlaF